MAPKSIGSYMKSALTSSSSVLHFLLRLIHRLGKTAFIILSLTLFIFNTSLMMFSGVFSAVFGAIEAIGLPSARAPMVAELNDFKKRNTELKKEQARLRIERNRLRADVKRMSARNAALKTRSQTLKANLIEAEGRLKRHATEAASITQRVIRRTARITSANLAAMPLESVPFVGIATVAGVTALEVKGACDNASDVRQLNELINPGAETDTAVVCGVDVPSADDLWRQIGPGGRQDRTADCARLERLVDGETAVDCAIAADAATEMELPPKPWAVQDEQPKPNDAPPPLPSKPSIPFQ